MRIIRIPHSCGDSDKRAAGEDFEEIHRSDPKENSDNNCPGSEDKAEGFRRHRP